MSEPKEVELKIVYKDQEETTTAGTTSVTKKVPGKIEELNVVRAKFVGLFLWYTFGGTHEKYISLQDIHSVEWTKKGSENADTEPTGPGDGEN